MNERTVVIGGGITGLAVAIQAARAGRKVVVLERTSRIGGRGRSDGPDGFAVNLGPHAIYPTSKARLSELGVEVEGSIPNTGLTMRIGGRVHPLPTGALEIMASGALSMAGKAQLVRALSSAFIGDPARLDDVTVDAWLAPVTDARARGLMEALVRVTTYTNAPSELSAGTATRQLRTKAVYYLDGGWQRVVDQLEHIARGLGVEIRTKAHAETIVHEDGVVRHVVCDGAPLACEDVVVTLGPKAAATLLGGGALREVADRARAVRAACLDVSLRSLPRHHPRLVLGVDRPTYLSVHSKVANLAPEGGAVIHLTTYLPPGETIDPAALRAELELELDAAQPGWRDVLIEARWSPAITVMHTTASVATRGTRARPAIDAAGVRGVWLAGDWVGPDGMLLDACLESAKAVGERLRASVRAAA